MANNSLQKRNTIKEGRNHANAAAANNIYRALSDSSSSKVHTPNSPLSYFFSITIAQPKIRIKIPEVLAKTMQRRSDHHDNDQCNDNLNKPKKIFGKKFGLVLCKVFGHKKSSTLQTCSSNCGNGKVYSNGIGTSGGLADGRKAKMSEKVEFDNLGSVESMMRSCQIDNGDQGKQSRDVAEVVLPKLKNILENEEEEGKKKRLELDDQERRHKQQPCREYNQGQLSFKNLFKKERNGFSFFEGNKRSGSSSSNGVAATDIAIGRKENSSDLPRVPSRIMTTRRKFKKARSITKNLHEQIGEERGREERVGVELCKKRILMGEKCRPMSHSGTLHCDKDGNFLPENFP